MEPGLRLLIQLILEFAPVIVALVQKRTEEGLNKTTHQLPQVIQEVFQAVNISTRTDNYTTGVEQEKLLQKQLAVYHRETQLQIVNQERQTAIKLPEINKILDSWPLRLYPSQILDSHTSDSHAPLKIFLAPPQVKFDQFDEKNDDIPEIELILAEGLRKFINKHYYLQNPIRPIEFLAGAWDSKRFHSESSIKALFGVLKTEPILILESETEGDYLNFRIAYWGLRQASYYYKTIARLSYQEILQQSAKSRALEWQKTRNKLLALGENLAEVNQLGKDNVWNLAILEKAEKWQAKGIDVSKLDLQYQVNYQDFEQLCQVLITCHILVAAWVADVYHLIHYDVPPLLPELLPDLLKDVLDWQSLQAITTGYKQVYQALEQERRYWVPELALQLAQSLSHLPDRSLAQEQIDYSIATWLELREVSPQQFFNPLEAMSSTVRIEDEEYIQKLKQYFTTIGESQSVNQLEKILDAIANLKHKLTLKPATLSYTQIAHPCKVTAVAISPDMEILVSGCADRTIRMRNFQTGKLTRTLDDCGEVSSVAISPDGNLLAVGSCEHPRSNVRVWHLKTGKLIHTLLGHQKPVNVVVISPDGQILASGSNKIKIWNLHKGDRICTLWHSSAVHAIAISADGQMLVSGSSDNKIRLWNPRTGDPLRTLSNHEGDVKAIAISPDGQLLLSGGADKTIKIWHLITGKVLHTLTEHTEAVKCLAVSQDGQTLFSGSVDKTIKIWCVSTGKLLQTLSGHLGPVNSLALSSDGKLLISGSSDKTIKIWQIVV
ncbi:MAG: WD40 repeat domain-containing protein [Desmonostoc vinosum HA7617-LM4]|jgi:hypothetical protein|nr:WD40 repeat domain-containing protein [Desmonostoc vinosum HA7617-LM4]